MNKILLVLCVWFMSQTCLAQTPYLNKIYSSHEMEFPSMIVAQDSFFYCAGSYRDVFQSNNGVYMYKISKQGLLLNSNFYIKPYLWYFYEQEGAMIHTSDSCFVICASVTDSIDHKGFLLKFDKDLNILWKKEFSAPDSSLPQPNTGGYTCSFHNIKETHDKGYILIGEHYGTTTSLLYVVKTDKDGTIEWEKSYCKPSGNTCAGGRAYSIEVLGDSGYVIPCLGLGVSGARMSLLRIDTLGNELWHTPYFLNSNLVWGDYYCSALTSDSCILVNFDECYYMVSNPGTTIRSRPLVLKISLVDKSLKWKRFYNFYDSRISGIKELPGSDILLFGSEFNVDSIVVENYARMGLLLRLKANGDSVWYRKKEYTNGVLYDFNCFRGLTMSLDSFMVGVGEYQQYSPYKSFTWLIKMDSLGCAYPNCLDTLVGISVMEANKESFLVVYPNPASDQLMIGINAPDETIHTLAIFDMKGNRLFSSYINSPSYTLDVSSLPSATYILQVLTAKGMKLHNAVLITH
jgi:hypothetical protein